MTDKEKLAENLLAVIPLMHKKLMKDFSTIGIPKQQLWLLFHINNEDGKLMSYYSEKMMIPKSNLTLIANKLIEEGLIEREFNKNDRRIIILRITEQGRKYLAEHRDKVKQNMIIKLDLFDEADIKKLNKLMEETREIFDKIEHEGDF